MNHFWYHIFRLLQAIDKTDERMQTTRDECSAWQTPIQLHWSVINGCHFELHVSFFKLWPVIRCYRVTESMKPSFVHNKSEWHGLRSIQDLFISNCFFLAFVQWNPNWILQMSNKLQATKLHFKRSDLRWMTTSTTTTTTVLANLFDEKTTAT